MLAGRAREGRSGWRGGVGGGMAADDTLEGGKGRIL